MELGLAGRVALVTGAGAGIGAAIAEALAGEGAEAWIGDLDREAAERTAGEFGARGLTARAVVMDVADPASVASGFARVRAEAGRLDILVNNAGILKTGPFRDATAGDWEQVVGVNLSGVVHCLREAIPLLTESAAGRIVNIASVSAMRGGGSLGNVLYGTTKAGVVALTLGLARELGPHGVTVNAIAPAVADTPMTRAMLGPEVRERVTARIPLGRLATPAEIADAVAFLASDRASFITGAVLPVDGGILTT